MYNILVPMLSIYVEIFDISMKLKFIFYKKGATISWLKDFLQIPFGIDLWKSNF